jgi:hypothetical protein
MRGFMLACVLGALALPARAGSLELLVTESGGPTIAVVDNGLYDQDPTVGVINANTTLLNPLLTNYVFTDLSAASNSPGTAVGAYLVQQGTAFLTPGHSGVLTVLASDVDYVQPDGVSRTLSSSASNTYTNADAGDSNVFKSWFNGSNTLGALETPSPSITLVSTAGNPNSEGSDATPIPVSLADPYGLTNRVVIGLSGGQPGTASRDAWTGATVVVARAIPEPSSMSLLLGALPVLVMVVRRRRP